MTDQSIALSTKLPGSRRRYVRTRIARSDGRWHLLALVLLAVLWQILGSTLDFIYLPPLTEVVSALGTLITDGTITAQLGTSLRVLAEGLVISIVVGVVVGVLMGLFRAVRFALDVYVDAMMAAPMVAFVPLFILLFGLGEPTRLVVVVMFAVFPIIVNTQVGIQGADARIVEMGRSFGVRGLGMLLRIRLPMALPQIQAGVRLGVSRGVDGLITGELLIAVTGIGGLISKYGNAFTMPKLYAMVLVVVVIALLAVRLADVAMRLLFGSRRR